MITETPRLRIRELTIGDAEFWRRGFAYEAACAVMEYGRAILRIEKIVGLTSSRVRSRLHCAGGTCSISLSVADL